MGHVGAAVVGLNKKLGIVGVDPHIVAVGMGRLQLFPGLSAIGGAQVIGRHHVDGVRIQGVRLDVGVVERPRAQALVARDLAETLALIVRAVQTALLARRFDQGVDDARIGARYGQIDLADQRIGQTLANPPPVAPAIAGLVQAAFLSAAAADDGPGLALGLPGRGQHHIGVGRQQLQIGKADPLGHFQHTLPALAAVAAAIYPALGVGVKRLANRRDPHHVVVARIDLHRADLPHPLQTDRVPTGAAVAGAIHTAPGNHVGAQTVRARAHVEDVGVRLRHADSANRRGGKIAVGHVAPALAVIGALPDAAAGSAQIERARRLHGAGDRGDPPAARRANAAVGQRLQGLGSGL